MQSLVVTIVGPDRPGLVETLARTVADHGATWVESSMSTLAGQFAGVVRVLAPKDRAQELQSALEGAAEDLRVVVQRGTDESDEAERQRIELDLVGGDRPGIVKAVTKALVDLGVNVQGLETSCDGAPWSGDALFRAHAKLEVPAGVDLVAVRESVEAVAADLMVDITLQPAKA